MTQETQQTVAVESIRVRTPGDTTPDLSYLGVYRNEPGPEDRTIDRKHRGDMRPGQYRYFVAANGSTDPGKYDAVEADYARYEALNRGEWSMHGVVAEARFVVNGVRQRVTSGGLWGIASDSGRDYFDSVAAEEVDGLRRILTQLGIDHSHEAAEWSDDALCPGVIDG